MNHGCRAIVPHQEGSLSYSLWYDDVGLHPVKGTPASIAKQYAAIVGTVGSTSESRKFEKARIYWLQNGDLLIPVKLQETKPCMGYINIRNLKGISDLMDYPILYVVVQTQVDGKFAEWDLSIRVLWKYTIMMNRFLEARELTGKEIFSSMVKDIPALSNQHPSSASLGGSLYGGYEKSSSSSLILPASAASYDEPPASPARTVREDSLSPSAEIPSEEEPITASDSALSRMPKDAFSIGPLQPIIEAGLKNLQPPFLVFADQINPMLSGIAQSVNALTASREAAKVMADSMQGMAPLISQIQHAAELSSMASVPSFIVDSLPHMGGLGAAFQKILEESHSGAPCRKRNPKYHANSVQDKSDS